MTDEKVRQDAWNSMVRKLAVPIGMGARISEVEARKIAHHVMERLCTCYSDGQIDAVLQHERLRRMKASEKILNRQAQ